MNSIKVQPSPNLKGTLNIPGDKSISHRAVMLSALSHGKSLLKGLLLSEDVKATIRCFRALGVSIDMISGNLLVQGVGLKGLRPPAKVLDCGNSGTTLRLMMGILAGQPFTSRLTGDASLNQRPMERVAKPLREMGAQIEEMRASPAERVIKITGRLLKGIHYDLPMASAQVKSAILLAGLYASGETRVKEPIPSRNHTELMLLSHGISLACEKTGIILAPNQELKAQNLEIPGDISSAAFFLVGGCLGTDSKLLLKKVGINPTRTGMLDVLTAMGASIHIKEKQKIGGEEVADLEVSSSQLKATSIQGDLIPRLIDEIPILSVAAAVAEGTTSIRNAEELRVKETDRIKSIKTEYQKLGVLLKSHPDGLDITGPTSFQVGEFQSHGDHRIAMSLAVAATQAMGVSTIHNVDCVNTSYPGFFEDLKKISS